MVSSASEIVPQEKCCESSFVIAVSRVGDSRELATCCLIFGFQLGMFGFSGA